MPRRERTTTTALPREAPASPPPRRDDLTTRLLRRVWDGLYRGTLRNPLAPTSVRLLGGSRELSFRSGFRYRADRGHLALAHELMGLTYHGARLTRDGSGPQPAWTVRPEDDLLVTPGGIRFSLESLHHLIFAETFIYDVHFAGFDLTGRTVVDVGANVGDTALYFAEKGARVLAFEPDEENFRRLKRNLELNPGLAPRIEARREAVGEDGEVRFFQGLGGGSGMYVGRGQEVRVRSVSLATLLDNRGLDRAFLLKADCKGCEFQLVRQPGIRRFDRVAIEYASELGVGTLAELVAGLRAQGFNRQRTFKHGWGPWSVDKHGILQAEAGP